MHSLWSDKMNVFEQTDQSRSSTIGIQTDVYLQASAYEKLGNDRRALELFSEVLEAHPEHFPSALHTGDILRRSGQPKEALEAYKLAETYLKKSPAELSDQLSPFFIWVLIGKGFAFEAIKDATSALDCYRSLLGYRSQLVGEQFPEGLQRRINALEKLAGAADRPAISNERLARALGEALRDIADRCSKGIISETYHIAQYRFGSNREVDQRYIAWWTESLFLASFVLQQSKQGRKMADFSGDLVLHATGMALNMRLSRFREQGYAIKVGFFESLLTRRLPDYTKISAEVSDNETLIRKYSLFLAQSVGMDSFAALSFIPVATRFGQEALIQLEQRLNTITKKIRSIS